MPALTEICEVRAGSGIYRDWLSVSVSWDMLQNVYTFAQLVCAEPGAAREIGQRLKPSDPVEIRLAGIPVLRGKLRERQASYNATAHAVRIDAFGKAGVIGESSVDVRKTGVQFRDYDLPAIANRLLQRHGLKLRFHNEPSGARQKFPNFVVRAGETVREAIDRMARLRDCFVWADVDGNLKAGLPDGDGAQGVVLAEGVNILSANCTISDPSTSLETFGQDAGSDGRFGSKVAQIAAIASIGGFASDRLSINLAGDPVNAKEAQFVQDHETRMLLAQSLTATVTLKGWLKPAGATGAGTIAKSNPSLFSLGEQVTLKSPMLIPLKGGTIPLRVAGIIWSQNEAGTLTTLTLMNDAVFGQRFPDAKAADGAFKPGAEHARPDVPM